MSGTRTHLKTIAVAVSTVYFFSNCALAYTPENNFWAERRTHVLSNTKLISSNNTALIGNADDISTAGYAGLSGRYGRLRGADLAIGRGTGKVVIHIQDIHLNYEAQMNTSRTVQELMRGGKIGLIALEGAFTPKGARSPAPIDLRVFRSFHDQDTIAKVADYLLRTHHISGPVHAALTTQGSIPEIVGIDDESAHTANVRAYQTSAKDVSKKKARLALWTQDLERKEKETFNPALYELHKAVSSYRKNERPLADLLDVLAPQDTPVPHVIRNYQQASRIERGLDFNEVEKARKELVAELVRRMDEPARRSFFKESLAYRSGALSHIDFYLRLKRLCDEYKIKLGRYPAMATYVRYVLLTDEIDSDEFFAAVETLEDSALQRLVLNNKEQALLDESKTAYLTSKLIDFSLTPAEWEAYKEMIPGAHTRKPGSPLCSFEDFYREAEARDEAMTQNLMNAIDSANSKVTVLVTGGFHAKGIRTRLLDEGVAVVSYIPKITRVDTTSGLESLSIFDREKTPLEKLFAGQKLFVAPPPSNMGITGPLEVVALERLKRPHVPSQDVFKTVAPLAGDEVRVTAEVTDGTAEAPFRVETKVETPNGDGALAVGVDQDGNIRSDTDTSGSTMPFLKALMLSAIVYTGYRFSAIFTAAPHHFVPGFGYVLFIGYVLVGFSAMAIFLSKKDLTGLATGLFGLIGCGNVSMVIFPKRNPALEPTNGAAKKGWVRRPGTGYLPEKGDAALAVGKRKFIPDWVMTRLHDMGYQTQIRGKQAGGTATIMMDPATEQNHIVMYKDVNPKRGNLTNNALRGWVKEVQRAHKKGMTFPEQVMILGHHRFGTSSRPSKIETHPHFGASPVQPLVYRMNSGGVVTAYEQNFQIAITHNGDMNGLPQIIQVEALKEELSDREVGATLDRFYGKNPAQGDSPKAARLMNFLRTGGMWEASVRFGLIFEVEKTFKEPFKNKSDRDIAIQTQTLAAVFTDFFNEYKGRLYNSSAERLSDANTAVLKNEFLAAVIKALQRSTAVSGWSAEAVHAFAETTTYAFLHNDTERALHIYAGMQKSSSSHGFTVLSTLEPDQFYIYAKGQPITLGRELIAAPGPKGERREFWSYMTASEPAAVFASMDPKGQFLDMNDKDGEIGVLSEQGLRMFSLAQGKMIDPKEVEKRWIKTEDNPYLMPNAYDVKDPTRKDIEDITAQLYTIKDELESPESMNRKTMDRMLANFIAIAKRDLGRKDRLTTNAAIDFLLVGEQKSLDSLDRQFRTPLLKEFPGLNIVLMTGDEFLKRSEELHSGFTEDSKLERAVVGPNTMALFVSQSGQTFSTRTAAQIAEEMRVKNTKKPEAERKYRDLMILTGEWYSKMGQDLDQSYQADAPFSERILCNLSGRRVSEAASVATIATDYLLNRLVRHLSQGMHAEFKRQRPFRMKMSPASLKVLEEAEDPFFLEVVPQITGIDRYGNKVQSPHADLIRQHAHDYAMHSMELLIVTCLSIVITFVTVSFGVTPLQVVLSPVSLVLNAFSLAPIGPIFASGVINAFYYSAQTWILVLVLRIFQQRERWARTGTRSIVVASRHWVTLSNYGSRLLAEAIGHVEPFFDGRQPDGALVHEMAHRIRRGTLIFGTLIGNLALTQQQSQYRKGALKAFQQADGIANGLTSSTVTGPDIRIVTVPQLPQMKKFVEKHENALAKDEVLRERIGDQYEEELDLIQGFVFFEAMAEAIATFNIFFYKKRTGGVIASAMNVVIGLPLNAVAATFRYAVVKFFSTLFWVMYGSDRMKDRIMKKGVSLSNITISTTQTVPPNRGKTEASRDIAKIAEALRERGASDEGIRWIPESGSVSFLLAQVYTPGVAEPKKRLVRAPAKSTVEHEHKPTVSSVFSTNGDSPLSFQFKGKGKTREVLFTTNNGRMRIGHKQFAFPQRSIRMAYNPEKKRIQSVDGGVEILTVSRDVITVRLSRPWELTDTHGEAPVSYERVMINDPDPLVVIGLQQLLGRAPVRHQMIGSRHYTRPTFLVEPLPEMEFEPLTETDAVEHQNNGAPAELFVETKPQATAATKTGLIRSMGAALKNAVLKPSAPKMLLIPFFTLANVPTPGDWVFMATTIGSLLALWMVAWNAGRIFNVVKRVRPWVWLSAAAGLLYYSEDSLNASADFLVGLDWMLFGQITGAAVAVGLVVLNLRRIASAAKFALSSVFQLREWILAAPFYALLYYQGVPLATNYFAGLAATATDPALQSLFGTSAVMINLGGRVILVLTAITLVLHLLQKIGFIKKLVHMPVAHTFYAYGFEPIDRLVEMSTSKPKIFPQTPSEKLFYALPMLGKWFLLPVFAMWILLARSARTFGYATMGKFLVMGGLVLLLSLSGMEASAAGDIVAAIRQINALAYTDLLGFPEIAQFATSTNTGFMGSVVGMFNVFGVANTLVLATLLTIGKRVGGIFAQKKPASSFVRQVLWSALLLHVVPVEIEGLGFLAEKLGMHDLFLLVDGQEGLLGASGQLLHAMFSPFGFDPTTLIIPDTSPENKGIDEKPQPIRVKPEVPVNDVKGLEQSVESLERETVNIQLKLEEAKAAEQKWVEERTVAAKEMERLGTQVKQAEFLVKTREAEFAATPENGGPTAAEKALIKEKAEGKEPSVFYDQKTQRDWERLGQQKKIADSALAARHADPGRASSPYTRVMDHVGAAHNFGTTEFQNVRGYYFEMSPAHLRTVKPIAEFSQDKLDAAGVSFVSEAHTHLKMQVKDDAGVVKTITVPATELAYFDPSTDRFFRVKLGAEGWPAYLDMWKEKHDVLTHAVKEIETRIAKGSPEAKEKARAALEKARVDLERLQEQVEKLSAEETRASAKKPELSAPLEEQMRKTQDLLKKAARDLEQAKEKQEAADLISQTLEGEELNMGVVKAPEEKMVKSSKLLPALAFVPFTKMFIQLMPRTLVIVPLNDQESVPANLELVRRLVEAHRHKSRTTLLFMTRSATLKSAVARQIAGEPNTFVEADPTGLALRESDAGQMMLWLSGLDQLFKERYIQNATNVRILTKGNVVLDDGGLSEMDPRSKLAQAVLALINDRNEVEETGVNISERMQHATLAGKST